jgi:hypothetical protein
MIIAALDIGSNSIHLVVVETDHEKPFRVVASAKEAVRLGRSAARDERLSANRGGARRCAEEWLRQVFPPRSSAPSAVKLSVPMLLDLI